MAIVVIQTLRRERHGQLCVPFLSYGRPSYYEVSERALSFVSGDSSVVVTISEK